jgi:alpha-tubulin suppressor-like RCC1 family protein
MGRKFALAIALIGVTGASAVVGLAGTAGATTTAHAWGTTLTKGPRVIRPREITGISGTIVQIATSNAADYALTSDGTVYAWGENEDGELGNGTTKSTYGDAVPVKFPTGVVIAHLPNPMPYNTGLAIDTKGNVWGWGRNGGNELCISHKTDIKTPIQLPLSDVSLATGAGGHALYDEGGSLIACGVDTYGELGDGHTKDSASSQPVVGLPTGSITALTSSWQGSGAVLANGSYYDWGYNANGQLGDGHTHLSDIPLRVPLEAPVVQAYQGGSNGSNGQTLVVLRNKTVWGWGSNSTGQLDVSRPTYVRPVQVIPPAGVTWVWVATNGNTSYAIDTNGHVWAWGLGSRGQLGYSSKKKRSGPRQVPSLSGALQVVGTAHNAMGLTSTAPAGSV